MQVGSVVARSEVRSIDRREVGGGWGRRTHLGLQRALVCRRRRTLAEPHRRLGGHLADGGQYVMHDVMHYLMHLVMHHAMHYCMHYGMHHAMHYCGHLGDGGHDARPQSLARELSLRGLHRCCRLEDDSALP